MEYGDCEAVFEIARQTLPEYWSLEELQKVLQYDYNMYYVAIRTEEDRIIGFAGIMVIAEDAELLNIAVHPDCQSQGIGEMLMNTIIQQAWQQQAERILLEVRSGNRQAQALYEKKGFEVIGTRKNYYSNPTEDAIIMSCMKQ